MNKQFPGINLIFYFDISYDTNLHSTDNFSESKYSLIETFFNLKIKLFRNYVNTQL